MTIESEERLQQLAQQLRDRAEAEIDGETLSRLTQARHRALEQTTQKKRRLSSWPLPVGVAASVMAAVIVVMMWQGMNESPILEQVSSEEMALVASEDIEFFEELEFYEWLESENASS